MARREHFTITFDGEALQAGLMDVRDLAPSLLAIGDLLQEANRVVNGGRSSISVKVRSHFNRGSFEVSLVLVQGLLEQAQEFLRLYPSIKDTKELLEILFFYTGGVTGAYGLLQFLKRLRGRELPKQGVVFQKNGDIEVNLDNEKVTINHNVYSLATNPTVRVAVERIVAPLQIEGIDKVQFSEGDQSQVVTKEEAPLLRAGEIGEETLIDNTREAVLSIVRLSFKPEHIWGLSDGTVKISATIQDQTFWDRVASGSISFSKGDQMRVRLRTRTARKENGDLKSDYTVEQVLEYIPRKRPTQIELQ
jgi:hypothetical protein